MKGNRPAVALDLVEDLRPVIVDAVVRRIVAQRRLTLMDFATSLDAGRTRVHLSNQGRHVFFAAYEDRMRTPTYDPTTRRGNESSHIARRSTSARRTLRPRSRRAPLNGIPCGGAEMELLVAFDIGSNSRRRRVTAVILERGERLQRSVFTVDGHTVQTLRAAVEPLIDPRHDVLMVWSMPDGAEPA